MGKDPRPSRRKRRGRWVVLFLLAGIPGCGGRSLRALHGAGEGDVSAAAGAGGAAAAMVELSGGSTLDPH